MNESTRSKQFLKILIKSRYSFNEIFHIFLCFFLSKRPKSGSSVSSVGTGYCEKSPVPSALSPTPQVLGANVLQDTLENPRNRRHAIVSNDNENDNSESRNIDNPVFGETNENSYGATIKSRCNYKI